MSLVKRPNNLHRRSVGHLRRGGAAFIPKRGSIVRATEKVDDRIRIDQALDLGIGQLRMSLRKPVELTAYPRILVIMACPPWGTHICEDVEDAFMLMVAGVPVPAPGEWQAEEAFDVLSRVIVALLEHCHPPLGL